MAVRHEQRNVFDQGVWGRSQWRRVRRILLRVVFVLLCVELLGLPEVRIRGASEPGGPIYLGFDGLGQGPVTRRLSGSAAAAPLVVLRKLERSLLEVARGAVDDVLEMR